MSPKQTDEGARLAELEATIRGLTQELVEANERIRRLEEAVDGDVPAPGERSERPTFDAAGRNGESDDGGSTKQMGEDGQADDEAGADLDDIIVA